MNRFAQIFFVVGTIWGASAFILMIAAWRSVRRGDIASHRRFILILLVGGWCFVAFYLTSYSLDQTYSDFVPERLVPWLAFHGVVALLTLFVITVLVWARFSAPVETDEKYSLPSYINRHHRFIGTITALLWLLTQAGGFINLYILR